MIGQQGQTAHPIGDPAAAGWVTWLIAAVFAIAGFAAIHANTFLNNEGVYSWMFSGLTRESPPEMLFYLNARPPIAVLYMPVAVLGLTPFLWAHLLLAVLAIPLTASLARHFGHGSPNFSALLVAVSPLYFAAAASGVQNTDGTVGLLFAVWLLVRRRPVAAGMVLSLVVLARVEIAFFGAVLAAYALTTPWARRFIPAALVIPIVYVLCGAVYHGDLLWALRYPSFPTTNELVDPAARARYGGDLQGLILTVLALTPVIGVVLWTPFRRCARLEALLILAAIAFVLAIRVLPFTHLIYVDASPRYILPALPYLCLGISRAVDGWGLSWRGSLARGAVLLAIAGLLGVSQLARPGYRDVLWIGGSAGAFLLAACGACLVAAGLAFVSKRAAMVALLGAAAVGGIPLLPSTHLFLGDQARQLDECVRWIAASRSARDGAVVTDLHLLRFWIDRYAPELHADVRHLVTKEMLYQARFLTNPATRQFEAMRSARFNYAPWIFPEEIADLRGGVLVVLRTDIHRSDPSSDPPLDRVDWLAKGRDWRAGRLTADVGAAIDSP